MVATVGVCSDPSAGGRTRHDLVVRWPLTRVAVAGRSMLPTLHPGDWCLVVRGAPVQPGRVVVLERPDRPGLLVVKRVRGRRPDGWWVEGDNPAESDDSRLFGAVPADAVLGRVVWRYHPLRRRRWPR